VAQNIVNIILMVYHVSNPGGSGGVIMEGFPVFPTVVQTGAGQQYGASF